MGRRVVKTITKIPTYYVSSGMSPLLYQHSSRISMTPTAPLLESLAEERAICQLYPVLFSNIDNNQVLAPEACMISRKFVRRLEREDESLKGAGEPLGELRLRLSDFWSPSLMTQLLG